MNLQDSVLETVKKFENTLTLDQQKKMDRVHELFEEMVSKGLISRPTYNLESIGTILTDISRLRKH